MTTTGVPPLRAVTCGATHAVPGLLHVSGFDLVVAVRFARDAIAVVEREHPHVVVLDVAACGTAGLATVGRFLEVSPESAVILVSPFEGLRAAALEAGVLEMVGTDDLRPLLECLRRTREAAHGAVACVCCTKGSSAMAFDAPMARIITWERGGRTAAARGR